MGPLSDVSLLAANISVNDFSLSLRRFLQEVAEVEQSDDQKNINTIWIIGWVVISLCGFLAFISIQLIILMGIIICCRKLR